MITKPMMPRNLSLSLQSALASISSAASAAAAALSWPAIRTKTKSSTTCLLAHAFMTSTRETLTARGVVMWMVVSLHYSCNVNDVTTPASTNEFIFFLAPPAFSQNHQIKHSFHPFSIRISSAYFAYEFL